MDVLNLKSHISSFDPACSGDSRTFDAHIREKVLCVDGIGVRAQSDGQYRLLI